MQPILRNPEYYLCSNTGVHQSLQSTFHHKACSSKPLQTVTAETGAEYDLANSLNRILTAASLRIAVYIIEL